MIELATPLLPAAPGGPGRRTDGPKPKAGLPALDTLRAWLRAASGRKILGLGLIACALIPGAEAGYIHAKAQLSQLLLERAFDQSLAAGHRLKPWAWADVAPAARLEIRRIGAEAIVLGGSSGQAMAFGPALQNETARIGEPGTTVISAHRDTHFAFLKDVQAGDIITLTRDDGLTFAYRVTGTRVVDWNHSGIDRFAPGRHLALATCYPFGGIVHGPQRYVVEAEMI